VAKKAPPAAVAKTASSDKRTPIKLRVRFPQAEAELARVRLFDHTTTPATVHGDSRKRDRDELEKGATPNSDAPSAKRAKR
jgi:hypothetical protein